MSQYVDLSSRPNLVSWLPATARKSGTQDDWRCSRRCWGRWPGLVDVSEQQGGSGWCWDQGGSRSGRRSTRSRSNITVGGPFAAPDRPVSGPLRASTGVAGALHNGAFALAATAQNLCKMAKLLPPTAQAGRRAPSSNSPPPDCLSFRRRVFHCKSCLRNPILDPEVLNQSMIEIEPGGYSQAADPPRILFDFW